MKLTSISEAPIVADPNKVKSALKSLVSTRDREEVRPNDLINYKDNYCIFINDGKNDTIIIGEENRLQELKKDHRDSEILLISDLIKRLDPQKFKVNPPKILIER